MDPSLDTSNPQAMTGYTYAADNPVTGSDPTGQFMISGGGGGCVGSVAFCVGHHGGSTAGGSILVDAANVTGTGTGSIGIDAEALHGMEMDQVRGERPQHQKKCFAGVSRGTVRECLYGRSRDGEASRSPPVVAEEARVRDVGPQREYGHRVAEFDQSRGETLRRHGAAAEGLRREEDVDDQDPHLRARS